MLKLICLALAAVVALSLSSSALAAGKMVPEEGAVEVMLLLQPDVCKELNLSQDKRDKIHNFASAQWQKAQTLADLDEKERDKKFEANKAPKAKHKDNIIKRPAIASPPACCTAE